MFGWMPNTPKVFVNGKMESLKHTIVSNYNKVDRSKPDNSIKNARRLKGFNTSNRQNLSPSRRPQQIDLAFANTSTSQDSDTVVNRTVDTSGLDVSTTRSRFSELRVNTKFDRPSVTRNEKSRGIKDDSSPGRCSIVSGQSAYKFNSDIMDQLTPRLTKSPRRNTVTKATSTTVKLNPIRVKDIYIPNGA